MSNTNNSTPVGATVDSLTVPDLTSEQFKHGGLTFVGSWMEPIIEDFLVYENFVRIELTSGLVLAAASGDTIIRRGSGGENPHYIFSVERHI